MAIISLYDYLDKLEDLLGQNATDQVILHSRHILARLPRNIYAHRALGQALLAGGHDAEAEDVLRRVLAVFPDDFAAHVGLLDVYERGGQGDRAIWHAQRAYEQRPNDTNLIGLLRELYRRHRNILLDKVPLTVGAAARQDLFSGQALKAVERLAAKAPFAADRHDLRLLLAQALEAAGRDIDAAEQASAVLAALPDCLEANRILARVWLNVGRASDARPYVERLEALDPYLALRMVQSDDVAEDAIQLDELDAQQAAARQSAAARPDWLQGIDDSDSALGAVLDDAQDTAAPSALLNRPDEAAPAEDMPDWLRAAVVGGGDAAPAEDDQAAPLALGTGEHVDDAADADPLAWLSVPEDADTADANAPLAASDADDPFAWMRASGVAIDDAPAPDVTATDDNEDVFAPSDDSPVDPLAWMRGSGIELADDDAPERDDDAQPIGAVAARADTDDDDPFAWMRDSGIELADDDAPERDDDAQPIGAVAAHADTDDNPFACVATRDADTDDDDPFAWMRDSGIALADDADDAPAAALPTSGSLPSWQADDEDALRDLLAVETLDDDDLFTPVLPSQAGTAWQAGEDAEDTGVLGTSGAPDGGDDEAAEGVPSWWAEAEVVGADVGGDDSDAMLAVGEVSDDALGVDWLTREASDAPPDDAAPLAATDGGVDALSEDAAVADDDSPGLLRRFTGALAPQSGLLQGLQVNDWDASESDDTTRDDPRTLAGEVAAEPALQETTAMSGNSFDEFDFDDDHAEDTPDWFADLASNASEAQGGPVRPAASDDPFAFAFEDDAASSAPGSVVGEDMAWLSELDRDDAEDDQPADAVAASALPDSEAVGVPPVVASLRADDDEASAEDAYAWLSEVPSEPVTQAGASSQDYDASMDWLRQLNEDGSEDDLFGEDAALEDAASAYAEAGLAEGATTPDDAAFVLARDEAGRVDWLTGPAEDNAEALLDDDVAAAFAFDATTPLNAADDLQPDAVPVAPDLFAEANIAQPGAADASSDEDDFDLFAELEADDDAADGAVQEDAAVAVSDMPDWMREIAPVGADDDLDADDDLALLLERADEDVDLDALDIEDVSGLVDGMFVARQPDDPLRVEGADTDLPDWFEDEQTPEDEQERYAQQRTVDVFFGEQGTATRGLAERDDAEDAAGLYEDDDARLPVAESEGPGMAASTDDDLFGADDDDFFEDDDALFDDDTLVEDDVVAVTPVANAPDWLNAMVPGLDLDYTATEDTRIETEYVPDAEQDAEPAPAGALSWLSDLVDEESRPDMTPIVAAPTDEDAARPARRGFQFSVLPRWMRRDRDVPSASPAAPSAVADAAAPGSSLGEDLPPWLRDALDADDTDTPPGR